MEHNRDRETFLSLTSSQKGMLGLLSIGTFLEYFDFMLYIHMAVLLNELFFPKTDPFTSALLSAFAFSSSYILRPVGALIFGFIGDKYGRKFVVVITTTMMAISCFVMANLPTYAQIGIMASWIITICRILQGLATMGEVMGANIYITETIRPPIQYPAVTLMSACGVLGGAFSLGLASLVVSYGFNWRSAFWAGVIIAIVGAKARTKLKETKDYSDAKLRVVRAIENTHQDVNSLKNNVIWNEKVNKRTLLSLFFIECSWPVCFYFSFVFCGGILKNTFNFSPEQIIHQNFILSLIQLFSWIILMYFSYIVHPLKILKFKLAIFSTFIICIPYLLTNIQSGNWVLFIQSFVIVFGFMGTPAMSIFYKYIPIFKRFTYVTLTYAISRLFIYVITSFGMVYCANRFGNVGILFIIVPVAIGYAYALYYFGKVLPKDLHHYQRAV